MKTATTTKKAAAKTASETTTSAGKVKPKRTAAEGLRDLFIDELKDIYWAENALVKALPKMIKNATAPNLVSAITNHLEETKNHVTRLEKVFNSMGEKAVGKKCDAMAGLLEEGNGILEDTEPGVVRDAGIIAAAQKVEHYEIATYGTLAAWAGTLGEIQAAELLKETLGEEKLADSGLTDAAYHNINFEAEELDE
ncbi:ferritin-like domain-containing protein [Flavobacterium sp.]|uniref:ferritin-like domain-containing protein n=1 Tax=Flavobacterium sp. TaxID=239 RepID=UPI0024872E73|nr:ferritin-like domain-containing protein [Flavobacterium sp.]MDI1318409.1 ferritin-like domain-containing protein [Flavobacterium sp.]